MTNIENQAQWRTDPAIGTFPASFNFFQERYLNPLGKEVCCPVRECESSEYGAVRFELDGQVCLFRQAKHTPKKIGQFVTLWKRPAPDKEIAPFSINDDIDRVIVFADEDDRFGVFVFTKAILAKRDIFAAKPDGGKRAFRVYAPWTIPVAAQAKRSKKWQCTNFIELTNAELGLTRLSQTF